MPYHIKIQCAYNLGSIWEGAVQYSTYFVLDQDEAWIEEHIARLRREGLDILFKGTVLHWGPLEKATPAQERHIDLIAITYTEDSSAQIRHTRKFRNATESDIFAMGTEVTNRFISGAPGARPVLSPQAEPKDVRARQGVPGGTTYIIQGPISSSYLAMGENATQHVTINGIDAERLLTLIRAINESLPGLGLDGQEQGKAEETASQALIEIGKHQPNQLQLHAALKKLWSVLARAGNQALASVFRNAIDYELAKIGLPPVH
jgi:hypothetical protein